MRFTILQWNVWYKEPTQHIAAFLKQHPADIVCLQELTFNHPAQTIADTSAFIAENLGFQYHHKEIPIESAEGEHCILANAIFSRFPISHRRSVYINKPRHNGGYDDEYRAYVEATLAINGTEITVGTVHMSYTHAFTLTPNKRAETDRLVKELKKHPARYIITGDFNAPPGSYTIEKISQALKNAGPDLDQKTWTTKPFSYNGFEETNLNWRLDHVFATPDLSVLSSEILETNHSDHLPIRAVIELSA